VEGTRGGPAGDGDGVEDQPSRGWHLRVSTQRRNCWRHGRGPHGWMRSGGGVRRERGRGKNGKRKADARREGADARGGEEKGRPNFCLNFILLRSRDELQW
jgi:hypothetical protein